MRTPQNRPNILPTPQSHPRRTYSQSRAIPAILCLCHSEADLLTRYLLRMRPNIQSPQLEAAVLPALQRLSSSLIVNQQTSQREQ